MLTASPSRDHLSITNSFFSNPLPLSPSPHPLPSGHTKLSFVFQSVFDQFERLHISVRSHGISLSPTYVAQHNNLWVHPRRCKWEDFTILWLRNIPILHHMVPCPVLLIADQYRAALPTQLLMCLLSTLSHEMQVSRGPWLCLVAVEFPSPRTASWPLPTLRKHPLCNTGLSHPGGRKPSSWCPE